jgi:alpha-amylase
MHALGVLFLLGTQSLAAGVDEWRTRSIYQVCPRRRSCLLSGPTVSSQLVTDRFAVSDNSGPPCDASAQRYCGGTWRGIINHLDYIQNMGFDAVWISPVVANIAGNTPQGEGYHG